MFRVGTVQSRGDSNSQINLKPIWFKYCRIVLSSLLLVLFFSSFFVCFALCAFANERSNTIKLGPNYYYYKVSVCINALRLCEFLPERERKRAHKIEIIIYLSDAIVKLFHFSSLRTLFVAARAYSFAQYYFFPLSFYI